MSEPVDGTEQSARSAVLEALNETYSVPETVGRASERTVPRPSPPQRDEPAQAVAEDLFVDLENFAIDLKAELSGPEFPAGRGASSESIEDGEMAPFAEQVSDVLPGLAPELPTDEGVDADGVSSRPGEAPAKDERWDEIWSSSTRQTSLPQNRQRRGPLFRLRRRRQRRRFRRLYPWWTI